MQILHWKDSKWLLLCFGGCVKVLDATHSFTSSHGVPPLNHTGYILDIPQFSGGIYLIYPRNATVCNDMSSKCSTKPEKTKFGSILKRICLIRGQVSYMFWPETHDIHLKTLKLPQNSSNFPTKPFQLGLSSSYRPHLRTKVLNFETPFQCHSSLVPVKKVFYLWCTVSIFSTNHSKSSSCPKNTKTKLMILLRLYHILYLIMWV